ncbi:LysR family transcriptional regulator [Microbacterium wangchenii]|uniref:LysR family transcriptional regulator n=1 Tax=Microbacterium wangchenii TaxID=2541726 RepID=A0ABX5SV26_9MICO|nr:LysR family transcriptional regulator [Microbacterium wangchenii]TXK09235.1 LysR family transcriptional regulator [Microbacterium wangchenii]
MRMPFSMRVGHTVAVVDLLNGVRAFAAVARRGSFSAAADDERTTQPVISRRIAALEEVLGGPLIERDFRPVGLTPLGRALLSNAQTLLTAERALVDAAASYRRGAVRLLVPPYPDAALWAAVRLRASATGVELDIEEDGRDSRLLRLRGGEVDAAILPVESARADWLVPLGLAQSTDQRQLTLASLRPTRADRERAARIVVLPEDSEGALLSTLRDTTARYGLAARQIHHAPDLVPALAGSLAGDDWILCSRAEADAWRLTWLPVKELPLSRTYRLDTISQRGTELFDMNLRRDVAAALGTAPLQDR